MDLERQMVCTTTMVNHNPSIADWVTETLHAWSANVTYRWVREFTGHLGARGHRELSEFDNMKQYWQQTLRSNGHHRVADMLLQCNDEGTWQSCFLTEVMPCLRQDRKMIHD